MANSTERVSPAWIEEIDHTGDVGISVGASSLEELFARAAWGMFSVLTDMEQIEIRETREVTVEADDRAAQMVAWLSELNFLHSTQYLLFGDFSVDHLGDSRLTATVGGEPIDSERHVIYTEIKAVTYHDLTIEETADGWRAQVIFDM